VIFYDTDKLFIIVDSHPRIPFRVDQSDIQRTIFAAVVDDDVFIVPVGLPQDTFEAFLQNALPL